MLVALATPFVAWLLEERAPAPPVPADGLARPSRTPKVHTVTRGQGVVVEAAPDAGPSRRLVFVALGLPESAAHGLEVGLTRRCTGDAGAATEQMERTDGHGVVVLADTPADCELELRATDPAIALREDVDGEITVLPTGALRMEAVTTAGEPIPEVEIVALFWSDRPPLARCRTDARGSCELVCPKGQRYQVRFAKPGYETAEHSVSCDDSGLRATLLPGRRVTVRVEGETAPLLSAFQLEVDAERSSQSRTIDTPGTYTFDDCPRDVLRVELSEALRPVLIAEVPPGADDAVVSLGPLVPRRLEIWVEHVESEYGFLPSPIDVRCERSPRLLVDAVASPDGKSDHARIEYAPEGPCVVTRGQGDLGWTTDEAYETVQVSPPAVVTVRRR